MSGFKTHHGVYKNLVIVVRSYVPLVWSYQFYNTSAEFEDYIKKQREMCAKGIDAIYCFNKERPLKEQATYSAGSTFSRVLINIIDHDLVDRRW